MITCSAGKGELTNEECLQCALDNPPCGYDYSLMRALLASNEARPDVHVTDITGCIKKAILTKRVPPSEHPHEMLVRSLGTWVHRCLELDEGTDPYIKTEIDVEGLGIVGRADVYYTNNTLVDFKTTRWMKPSYLPYNSHALQVNIYAQLLREMGDQIDHLWIQYIDMSGPSKCGTHKVPVRWMDGVLACPKCGKEPNEAHLGVYLVKIPLMSEDSLVEFITTRRDIILDALENDTTPLGEPSPLCNYCAYKDICEEAL